MSLKGGKEELEEIEGGGWNTLSLVYWSMLNLKTKINKTKYVTV